MPAARWTRRRPCPPRHRLALDTAPTARRRHGRTVRPRGRDVVTMTLLSVLVSALAVGGGVALQDLRSGGSLWEAVPGHQAGPGPVGPDEEVPVTDAPADSRADVAIAFALAQRGIPYVWGGDGPAEGGWDCSGLTKAAYGAAEVTLPRTAREQFGAGPHTTQPDDPAPGDLVFYGTPDRIHHVGLALGNGLMVHAPHTGTVVQVSRIRWSGDDYVGATRPAAPGTAVDPGSLGDVTVPPGPAPTDPAPQGPVDTRVDTPSAPAPDPVVLAAAPAGTGDLPAAVGAPAVADPAAPAPLAAPAAPAAPADPVAAPVVVPAPAPSVPGPVLPPGDPTPAPGTVRPLPAPSTQPTPTTRPTTTRPTTTRPPTTRPTTRPTTTRPPAPNTHRPRPVRPSRPPAPTTPAPTTPASPAPAPTGATPGATSPPAPVPPVTIGPYTPVVPVIWGLGGR